jgi:hypothetical protein
MAIPQFRAPIDSIYGKIRRIHILQMRDIHATGISDADCCGSWQESHSQNAKPPADAGGRQSLGWEMAVYL